ncbi:hypothetical protein [Caulobacter rhizosphaerae]|uniref:hypothetical protein n=1 Tax=Caulobacter rhizosphaerae TaxID=2010972 RepID=UPI0013D20486|nr:hypothetical protein [Caulobacter rhizosphaerae]GGL48660.1 hypothetical protein GCM10010983_52450 [Caulobacter rhizosphaerae]
MEAKAKRFLQAIEAGDEPPAPAASAAAPGAKRVRGTHIGGHFDREFVRRFALLKIELELDTSQLIKRAIDELEAREKAKRAFGA